MTRGPGRPPAEGEIQRIVVRLPFRMDDPWEAKVYALLQSAARGEIGSTAVELLVLGLQAREGHGAQISPSPEDSPASEPEYDKRASLLGSLVTWEE